MSTRCVLWPPTRSIARSWTARSSLAWAASERSETSSRKSVPPSAAAPHATGIEQPRADELQARAFDFQHEGADVRGQPEHLKVPFAEAATWIEGRFQ